MDNTEETEPEVDNHKEIFQIMNVVSKRLDADIIIINFPIVSGLADNLQEALKQVTPKSQCVFVMLTTTGGDANAAYVIGRTLQRCYKRVIICIGGDCYSAGTLIVLCAHQLVISDTGKLGPIDVQLVKKDELIERLSGLTVNIALDELRSQVSETFVWLVRSLIYEFGPRISFKTALDVSSTITSSLFGEVFKQIDPIRIGEDARSLSVARHYGERLGKETGNLKTDTIGSLLNQYPAHDAVIDRKEASELFNNVRPPQQDEQILLDLLGSLVVTPFRPREPSDVKHGILIYPSYELDDLSLDDDEDDANNEENEGSEADEDQNNGPFLLEGSPDITGDNYANNSNDSKPISGSVTDSNKKDE